MRARSRGPCPSWTGPARASLRPAALVRSVLTLDSNGPTEALSLTRSARAHSHASLSARSALTASWALHTAGAVASRARGPVCARPHTPRPAPQSLGLSVPRPHREQGSPPPSRVCPTRSRESLWNRTGEWERPVTVSLGPREQGQATGCHILTWPPHLCLKCVAFKRQAACPPFSR